MNANAHSDRTDPARTHEDVEVWSIMVGRIGAAVDRSPWHHPCYVQNFDWLRDFDSRPPKLKEINEWLSSTGWQVTYVDGYVPANIYQAMQAEQIFPISRLTRPLWSLDHSAAPDYVHDVLGHLPMLFDANYSALLHRWGQRAREATPTALDQSVAKQMDYLIKARSVETPDSAHVNRIVAELEAAQAAATVQCSRSFMFETFYTWAIEFGVICDGDETPRLIGAAALSSPGEMENIFAGRTQMHSFSDGAVGHAVDYTQYQRTIFKARNFDEYFAKLEAI